jgi:hypothetical protein
LALKEVAMRRRIASVGLILGLGITTSGCTLIGYGIGSGLDQRMDFSASEITRVSKGTTIDLRLSDGTVRRGRFVSVVRSFDATYDSEYEDARMAGHDLAALPPLGPIQIACTDGRVIDGLLAGFDPDAIWFRAQASALPSRLELTNVGSIRADAAAPLSASVISRLIRLGAIPTVSRAQLDGQPPVAPISLNRIVQVSYRGNDGRTVGTVLGLTLDALIVGANYACSHEAHCFE